MTFEILPGVAELDHPYCLAVPSEGRRSALPPLRENGECGRPAEMHVMLDTVESDGFRPTVNACKYHAIKLSGSGHVFAIHHYRQDGSECDMPGTAWHFERNLCVILDADPDRSWSKLAAEPASFWDRIKVPAGPDRSA